MMKPIMFLSALMITSTTFALGGVEAGSVPEKVECDVFNRASTSNSPQQVVLLELLRQPFDRLGNQTSIAHALTSVGPLSLDLVVSHAEFLRDDNAERYNVAIDASGQTGIVISLSSTTLVSDMGETRWLNPVGAEISDSANFLVRCMRAK